MEELCHMFQMKLDAQCIEWVRNAVEHCEYMMSSYKSRDSDIWSAMRSAFAPEKVTEEMLPGIRVGVDMDPNSLSYGECGSLLTTIAHDYFSRVDYFPLMDVMSISAWTTCLSIIGLLLVFGFIYVGLICYRKIEALRIIASVNVKDNLNVNVNANSISTGTDEELPTETSSKTIIIKVTETANRRDDFGTFAFRNGHQKEYPYKRAAVEEILNLLENYPNKLKFVVSCDDEDVYEDVLKFNITDKLERKSTSSLYFRSHSMLSNSNIGLSRSRIPIAFRSNLRARGAPVDEIEDELKRKV